MPTYIVLFRWTQKGIENIKESPSRLRHAKKALKAVGGRVQGLLSHHRRLRHGDYLRSAG